MSYNDLPEKMREAVEDELDVIGSDREYAAGVLLDSVNEDTSYDKNLASTIMEIIRETSLGFYIDDGEVVVD